MTVFQADNCDSGDGGALGHEMTRSTAKALMFLVLCRGHGSAAAAAAAAAAGGASNGTRYYLLFSAKLNSP